MLVERRARRLGLPLRRGGRGSRRARPFFPSSTNGASVGLGFRPFSCDYGLLAAPRAAGRAPSDPRCTLYVRLSPNRHLTPLDRGSCPVRWQSRAAAPGPGVGQRRDITSGPGPSVRFTQLPLSGQAVEKLPVTTSSPQFGFKNACFGPLKPDLKPLEPVYGAINVPGSSFSTGCGLLGNTAASGRPGGCLERIFMRWCSKVPARGVLDRGEKVLSPDPNA
jgi:hypothetical protein